MKKLIIIGLMFNSGHLAALSPFKSPNNPMPTIPAPNNAAGSKSASPAAAVPAWMKTSPWFGDSNNTVALDPALGDSSWTMIDQQGQLPGTPDTSASAFTAPNEDIPLGPLQS